MSGYSPYSDRFLIRLIYNENNFRHTIYHLSNGKYYKEDGNIRTLSYCTIGSDYRNSLSFQVSTSLTSVRAYSCFCYFCTKKKLGFQSCLQPISVDYCKKNVL